MNEDKKNAIHNFIATRLEMETIPAQGLLVAFGFSSLMLIALIGYMEDNLGISLGLEDFNPENFASLESIYDAFGESGHA